MRDTLRMSRFRCGPGAIALNSNPTLPIFPFSCVLRIALIMCVLNRAAFSTGKIYRLVGEVDIFKLFD